MYICIFYICIFGYTQYLHPAYYALHSANVAYNQCREGRAMELAAPPYPTFQHSTPSEQPMRYIAMQFHTYCTMYIVRLRAILIALRTQLCAQIC